ncbi:MAG: prepilin-type N-terminal cleavage/methylation domain-containing protein [Candidatus Hydrogenedentes bacterium]|nr:prepilin-type N-terminal cleavage/methylation domain-containing protein [Candidatus Hydrogenedentota bacterium]
MKRNKGFTLVELLVVMAIIAILAAIAIPNVQRWIARGRATQAITEIRNMELAITKMLSDAGRPGLADIFDPEYFVDQLGGDHYTWTDNDFEDVIQVYTETVTALLRKGRGALDTNQRTSTNGINLMRVDVVRNLGTSYMTDLAYDPWGNLYRVYPGPWPARYGLIPFRVYRAVEPAPGTPMLPGDKPADLEDALTLVSGAGFSLIDPGTGEIIERIGAPANKQKEVYIWSYGANLNSGQARYTAPDPNNPGAVTYTPNSLSNYEDGQEPELMGGGDDINNWDKEQSFMVFYN